ncbi:MAG: hypothetical protein V2I76_05260 [Roseobacter sp.]|jgi:hypothetical protein|nr:hypothetical protein [Roseobacter sp.]
MFIVSPSTLLNARALETRAVPKRMIGRISLLPRRGATWRMFLRLLFEIQVLRYFGALMPFVIAMFVWPELALPISQAPIPMLFLIYFVETRIFNIPKDKRAALVSDADMERTLDALQFNGRRILTKLAAGKGLETGTLHLVVEQSEIGRVPPLTLVSVQLAGADPQVLDLGTEERALVAEQLFDDTLTEAALHLVTLRESKNLRSVVIEAGDISAHARMAALLEAKIPAQRAREIAT